MRMATDEWLQMNDMATDEWIDRCMDGYGWMDVYGWMDGWPRMDGWMDLPTCVDIYQGGTRGRDTNKWLRMIGYG